MIVSGGAKGIDRAAMQGALDAGGEAAGVMADSLERAALLRDNRELLMESKLVLISPYDPAIGFNVGHAMQRNKLIYALADAALVVTSDFKKGGTWAGAFEQLNSLKYVPVFVRDDANASKGNSALLKLGGRPWPNPQSGDELEVALVEAAKSVAIEPRQDTLPLTTKVEPSADEAASGVTPTEVKPEKINPTVSGAKPSPEVELLNTVQEILSRELVEARTEEEVGIMLVVTKSQAKAWIAQLVKKDVLEKVAKSKPVRFRRVSKLNLLF